VNAVEEGAVFAEAAMLASENPGYGKRIESGKRVFRD
jgi:hypothetical protein